MSNEQQNPGDLERSAEPDLVDPDSVVLDEGTVSAEALEPELSVSPETLHLQEPALGAVEISRDTADAASLEDAAAEARAVAAEAEKAGTLVGGPMPTNTPTAEAVPEGTAPAGGTAGDAPRSGTAAESGGAATTTGTDPGDVLGNPMPHPSPDEVLADAATGTTQDATPHPDPDEVLATSRESESAGPLEDALREDGGVEAVAPRSLAEQSTTSSAAGPAEPVARAGDDTAAAPSPHSERDENPGTQGRVASTAVGGTGRSRSTPLLLIIGGGIVVLALIVWLVVSLLGGGGSEGRAESAVAGTHPPDVQAQADQHTAWSAPA